MRRVFVVAFVALGIWGGYISTVAIPTSLGAAAFVTWLRRHLKKSDQWAGELVVVVDGFLERIHDMSLLSQWDLGKLLGKKTYR